MRSLPLSLLVLCALSTAVPATEVYVDALHGSDASGSGTPAAPFKTIRKGVLALVGAGPHSVHVAPGLYDAALGEQFPIVLGSDVSLLGAGVHETILSGGGDGTLLDLRARALVSDLTLRRADIGVLSPPASGMHFSCVRRCAILQCDVGVYAFDTLHNDHGLAILSSVIAAGGVGVRAKTTFNDFNSVSLQIYGSTITGNAKALETVHEQFGSELYLGLFDSIVRGNGDDSISGWLAYLPAVSGNVLGEPALVGIAGNVAVDPLLAQGAVGDAHLTGSSSVVDLPAPAAPWPPQAMWVPQSAWVWESAQSLTGDIDAGARVLGAKVDPGADERALPSLYAWRDASLGDSFELRGIALPGELLLVYAGAGLAQPPLFGFVGILPPWVPLGSFACGASGFGALTLNVPSDASLVGADLPVQAARIGPAGVDGTNAFALRILP